jgi:hypothetical protein
VGKGGRGALGLRDGLAPRLPELERGEAGHTEQKQAD